MLETLIRQILEAHFGQPSQKIRPDWLINPETGRALEIDIFFELPERTIAIEVHGEQHFEIVSAFKMDEVALLKQQERDLWKEKTIQQHVGRENFYIIPLGTDQHGNRKSKWTTAELIDHINHHTDFNIPDDVLPATTTIQPSNLPKNAASELIALIQQNRVCPELNHLGPLRLFYTETVREGLIPLYVCQWKNQRWNVVSEAYALAIVNNWLFQHPRYSYNTNGLQIWKTLYHWMVVHQSYCVEDEQHVFHCDFEGNIPTHVRFENNSVAHWLAICEIRSTHNESEYESRADIYKYYLDYCKDELHKEGFGPEKFWNEMDRQFAEKGITIISAQKRINKKVTRISNLTFKKISNSVEQWLDLNELRSTDNFSEYTVKNEIYKNYFDYCQMTLRKEPVGVERFWREMDWQFTQRGTPIESHQKMVQRKRNYFCNLHIITQ